MDARLSRRKKCGRIRVAVGTSAVEIYNTLMDRIPIRMVYLTAFQHIPFYTAGYSPRPGHPLYVSGGQAGNAAIVGLVLTDGCSYVLGREYGAVMCQLRVMGVFSLSLSVSFG